MISARRPIIELAAAPSAQDSIALLLKSEDLVALRAKPNRAVATAFAERGLAASQALALHPAFAAGAGEILEIAFSPNRRIYLIGVGAGGLAELRKSAVALGRRVRRQAEQIFLASGSLLTKNNLIQFLNSYALSQYEFRAPEKSSQPKLLIDAKFELEFRRAEIQIEAVYLARDLIHTPSNTKSPDWLAQVAADQATAATLKVRTRSGNALKAFGGLSSIGGSSRTHPPRMIEISYTPRGEKDLPHVVIVGKGITFDTGGISLKRPYDLMMAMKSDMAGAAAVMATLLALPELAPKVRVTGLLMCAENAHSASAARPGDVITHYGGKKSEIIDTDAEGRLVLADGLAYADQELAPDYLIDIATLTGAATLGLGRQYAAMYSNDEKLSDRFAKLSEQCGERAWPMPLVKEYLPALNSAVADLANVTSYASPESFGGGSITAALYLQQFVGARRWLHLDIAGVGRSDSDSGENPKGGTGYGPRLLLEWLATL